MRTLTTLLLGTALCFGQSIANAEPPAATLMTVVNPKPIEVADKYDHSALIIRAEDFARQVLMAQRDKALAELREIQAQKDLDNANAIIREHVAKLREKCNAPEKFWDIGPTMEWQPALKGEVKQ